MNNRLIVRMTAPVFLSSGLLLAVGGLTAWHVQQMQEAMSEVLALNVASIRAAEELEIGIREVRSQIDRFLMTGDARHLEAIPPLRRETDRWLAEAERVGVTPREQELMAQVRQGYEHFFSEYDRISRHGRAPDFPERLHELIDRVLMSEILPPAHEYLDFNEEQIAEGSRENQRLGHRLSLGLIFLGVCGCGAGVFAGYGVAKALNRSIVQLNLPIRDAAGQLSQVVGPVTFAAPRELHDLEGPLRKIAGQIGAVVERLRQSERDVARAEQLARVGQMAAGMAHELRNPLMAMKLLVQAAAEEGGAALGDRDLAILEEEIVRLEGLTQTFLDFARPPRLEPRPFCPRSILEQVVTLLSGRAEQQGVGIVCRVAADGGAIEADPGQFRQVVYNLLLNALDALPQGGTVRVELTRERGGAVVLRVVDDGPGLPADLGPRIFEPFISTKETGLGLGLSLCRRIAESHGGTLTAAAATGGGAVFTLRLPAPKSVADSRNESATLGPTRREEPDADFAGRG